VEEESNVFFLIGNLTFDRRFLEHDDLTFSEKQKKVCVVSMRIKQQSVLKRLEKFELKIVRKFSD
jgi:hypothetical protein